MCLANIQVKTKGEYTRGHTSVTQCLQSAGEYNIIQLNLAIMTSVCATPWL